MHDMASGLLTPKKRTAEAGGAGRRESLLESRALRAIGVAYEQSARGFDDMIQAAVGVGALVCRTLDFAPTTALTPPLTSHSLADREAANCFGHAVVASECFERLGIEHFISYANQHAFVLLCDRKSDRSFMLDVATKELYQETTRAISGEDIIHQLELGGLRAVNVLDSRVLIRQLPTMASVDEFVSKRPWLSYANLDIGAERWCEPRPRDYLLQLLTLPSVPGRQLLVQQLNATIAVMRGDYAEAHQQLSDLAGLYLDVDSRNKLKVVDRLCRRLVEHKLGRQAIEVAKVVAASLVPGDASKNQLFLPDVMRRVAWSLGDTALMEQAIEQYGKLPSNNLVQGKLHKAQRQLGAMV